MTTNSTKVFNYLKEKTIQEGIGKKFTANEVKEALGFEKVAAVTGSVTGLVRKGLAERFKEEKEDGTEVSYFALTADGLNFNPNED